MLLLSSNAAQAHGKKQYSSLPSTMPLGKTSVILASLGAAYIRCLLEQLLLVDFAAGTLNHDSHILLEGYIWADSGIC